MIVRERYSPEDNEYIPVPEKPKKPGFGFWATFGLGLVVMGVNVLVTVIVLLVYLALSMMDPATGIVFPDFDTLIYDGAFLGIYTVISGAICIAVIFIIVAFKKDITARDYLGFKRPSFKAILFSLLLLAGFFAMQFVIDPLVSDSAKSQGWMDSLYISDTSWFVVFVIALVIVGPAFEELLFRGFLMPGFRYSKLGPVGAVVLTSVLWAVLHTQYSVYGITSVMMMGLLFGTVRLRSGSIWLPFLLHAINNLFAVIQLNLI